MPEVLKEWPQSWKYDYREMFDGKMRRYVPGEDFNCTPKGFRNTIKLAALNRRLHVRISIEKDGGVCVQAVGPKKDS